MKAKIPAQLSFVFDDEGGIELVETMAIQPPCVKKPIPALVENLHQVGFVLSDQLDAITGNTRQKVDFNMKAISLLKSKIKFTLQDKNALALYTGWGGASGAFDEGNKELGAYFEPLKQALSEAEYADAKASVLNAYYTDTEIVKTVWSLVEKTGFKGGRIIDPSGGTGNFIGAMPNEIRAKSHISIVEPDRISCKIAQALYDDDNISIFNCGIEKAPLRSGEFDLAISNIPFGDYRVNDPRFNNLKLNIHDYFFAKALDMVKEGGLVAFVTSTGTLEKQRNSFREYLQSKANFITALRLPSGAFAKLGNTPVATDIIVLQKQIGGKRDERSSNFINRTTAGANLRYDYMGYTCNQYFVDYPHMHIGKGTYGSRYSNTELKVVFDGDLKEAMHEALRQCQIEGWYKQVSKNAAEDKLDFLAQNTFVSGYLFDDQQRVKYITPEGELEDQNHLPVKAYTRLKGMVRIRDIVKDLIDLELKGEDGTTLRQTLNTEYDGFVLQNGNLLASVNTRLFSLDSSAPLLWSLEIFDDEKQTYSKADIFFKTTVSTAILATKAESLGDAIGLSYNSRGEFDITIVAKSLDISIEEAEDRLLASGLAFVDPESLDVVDAIEYLSGNVRSKYEIAKVKAESDSSFSDNVNALSKVVPPTVSIDEISIQLGATWIDAEVIEQFCNEIIAPEKDLEGENVCSIQHSKKMAVWQVEGGWHYLRSVQAKSEWGTARMDFFQILEYGLNQQSIKIYDQIRDGRDTKQVFNQDETLAAREKLEKIQTKFADWIKSDSVRASELEHVYNDIYNSHCNRKFDGRHLVVPGLNPNIILRDAQKDGIWRGIVTGNTMLQYDVGGGKTLIEIILAKESKRLGKAKKPMLVVPNHMLEAFAGEFMRAFPRANILAATKNDMEGEKRKTLAMRIATGNWDAVILTHSSFSRLKVSSEKTEEFVESEISKVKQAFLEMNIEGNNVRKFERAKKNLTSKLQSFADKSVNTDGLLPFEKFGVDLIIVDEADLFKNLYFATKKTRIAGMPSAQSAKAFDLYLKSRLIFDINGSRSRGLIFATATPVSNTIAEMYIMQKYLQPDALENANVDNFDAWAANFGREVTSIEVAPDGSGYRMHTRFCRFDNVPELMQLYTQVAEIRTAESLNLPVPKLKGGKHQVITAKPSKTLKEYVATLVERAADIRKGLVEPKEDNMLCVTNDGRKAALDMRNIAGLGAKDVPGSKVNLCINEIFETWSSTKDQRLTQLVFCDLSTPGNKVFSVYEDMRDKLVKLGVPSEEIAFAQDYTTDAKKTELHRKIRAGHIRVAFGSTELMGFGTNVQDRLVEMHQLDAPWKPRCVQQRDGRICRQGNMNAEVTIKRYVTEGSFDAYMWQTIETKAKAIEQLFGMKSGRTVDDISSAALTYAEVKALASGNPMVIEKAGVDNEVAKLSSIKGSWKKGRHSLEMSVLNAEDSIRMFKGNIISLKKIIEMKTDDYVDPTIVIEGIPSKSNPEVVDKLLKLISRVGKRKGDYYSMRELAQIGNFKLLYNYGFFENGVVIQDQSGFYFAVKFPNKAEAEDWLRSCLVNEPTKALMMFEFKVNKLSKDLDDLSKELAKPFEYEERLQSALRRQDEINGQLGLLNDEAGAVALEETM